MAAAGPRAPRAHHEVLPHYLDDGRRIWYAAEQAFATLVEVGLLQLGEPGPDGMRPVSLTEKGLAEFTALCERQQQ